MLLCLSPNGWNGLVGGAAPQAMAVATIDGIHMLARQGEADWAPAGHHLEGCHISSLVWEPENNAVLAGTHGQGLYLSLDGGVHWQRVAQDFASDNIFSVAIARQAGQPVFYAGLEPVGVVRSTDYGASWERLPAIEAMPGRERWAFPEPPFLPHVKSIGVDPRDGNVLYACVEQGALLKSTDGGVTWRELSSFYKDGDFVFRDIHRVMLAPDNPDVVWMTSGTGSYLSLDGGESWSHKTEIAFRVGYPDHFVISPHNSDTLFMAGAIAHPGTWRMSFSADGAVMRSRDRGVSWDVASHGVTTDRRANIEAMGFASWDDRLMLVIGNTDGQIFASEDEGESWTQIGRAAPVSKSLHYQPLQPGAAAGPPPSPKRREPAASGV